MTKRKLSLTDLQQQLSKAAMKQIKAGSGFGNSCNIYCGNNPSLCTDTCTTCTPAGNASNPNVPGGDKICVR
ncbi:MAG: hypothetical protein EKK39_02730 [Sphingobacteriales bacterium]|uniref:hypothetical protein n=1 Tax=Hydrotalea flava TaxID=714549 RepID=UPI000FB2083E|nr:hypothetical protein [Hydrotalea flava]RTL55517.1 MAG: hypothetical protein EKK39_02730 [Sphingobacteriales bacterium]